MTKTHEMHGIDANGIPRVYGTGPTRDVAETECRQAVIEYVRRRPETGPVAAWRVE